MKKTISALYVATMLAACSDGSNPPAVDETPEANTDIPIVYDLEVLSFSFPSISFGDESITLRVRNNSVEPLDITRALADTIFYISDDPSFESHWWSGASIIRSIYNETLSQEISGGQLLLSGHEATLETFADLPEMWNGEYFVKAEVNPSRLFRPQIGLTYTRSELWEGVEESDDRLFIESNYENNVSGVLTTSVVSDNLVVDNTGTCIDRLDSYTPTTISDAININVGEELTSPSCKTGAVLYSVQMTQNTPYELNADGSGSMMSIADAEGNFIRSYAGSLLQYQYVPSYTGAHLFYLYRRSKRDESNPVLFIERF